MMDTVDSSIETANKNIVTLLNDAGLDGLHLDDILYLLGFKTKKELIHRLGDLKNRGEIQEVEGGRWKKVATKMNGSTAEHQPETFITPSLQEELPLIHLPGDEKFSSYKNTLQEYCQKKHFSVPQYKAQRQSNGLVGTVTFSLNHVRCEDISGSVKEADARAAFEALRQLGYLKDATFEITTNQHKCMDSKEEIHTSKVKSGIQDHITFKMLLNEYALKKQLPCPTYKTVAANDAFFSTITFNDKQYKGLAMYKRQKDAEQNAAQVALTALLGLSPEELKRKEAGQEYASTVAKQIKSGNKDPITFKSQLNEFAQKKQLQFPTYDTVAVNGGFFSTVNFNNNRFKAMATCKKRKDAEQNAAQVALNALIGIPLPSDEPTAIGEADVIKMVSEARQASQPVALKNRLQEYCQRMSKSLPTYDTRLNDFDKTYQSTVTVEGVQYTGAPVKGKKNAETGAAEEALKALELMI